MENAENEKLSQAYVQKRIKELEAIMDNMPEYKRGAVSYEVRFNFAVLTCGNTKQSNNKGSQPSLLTHAVK